MYVLFLPSNENSLMRGGGGKKANFSIESSHRKTSNGWNQTPADKLTKPTDTAVTPS